MRSYIYGNRGNVDAVGVPLWIAGIPIAANLRLSFETTSLLLPDGTLPDGIDEVPVALDIDGEIVIAPLISVVPPNSVGTLQIAITVPTPSDFELRVWQNPPFFKFSLSLPVAECISKLAQTIGGVFPGVSCISKLGDELSKQLARIFITKDPETVKTGDVFFHVLTSCVGGLIKTEKLQLVRDMVGAVASGTAIGVECGEAFPVTPDAILGVTAVNAFDPNDKIGSQGVDQQKFISGEEPLRYSIFFENMETATAPAQEVVITDQLDMVNIDLSTLSLGPITFGDKQVVPPPGLREFTSNVDLRPDNDLIVRVEASLNTGTGILTWTFTSLDPVTGDLPDDPLAGFLPPNVNPPEGDGSVLFTVMPKEGLTTGTEIRNNAEIFFDVNEPIITPEWLNTLDNSTPISQVATLASTQSSADFLVEWSGTDEGAGIKDYTIFVSKDDGAFVPWLTNAPDESSMFHGEDGKTYAFYSVARDQTGNVEEKQEVSEATTTVSTNQPPVANAGVDQIYECVSPAGATVQLNGSGSTDPNNDPLTYIWDGSFGSLEGQVISPTLPLGTLTIQLTVDDGRGGSDSDTVQVIVQDTVPPTLSVSPSPDALWPPNHKLVPVSVDVSVLDTCDTEPICKIVSVSSNEPEDSMGGRGNTSPDWIITGDLTVDLRAERSGMGDGRIYTITVECVDNYTNSATGTVDVSVAHDKGKHKKK